MFISALEHYRQAQVSGHMAARVVDLYRHIRTYMGLGVVVKALRY